MNTYRIFALLFCVILTLVVVIAGGMRLISMVTAVSPAFAQTLDNLTPKVLQTQTAVVVYENPLVDEEGLSVTDLNDNKDNLLGQQVTVKGAFSRVEKPWGFWLTETSQNRSEIFVVTNDQIANSDVATFVLAGQKYLRVRGTLKKMVWTDEDTTGDVTIDQNTNGSNSRWVIVADHLSSISIATQ